MGLLRNYMWLWVICGMLFVSVGISLIFLLINKCLSRGGKQRFSKLQRGLIFNVESNKYKERKLDGDFPALPPRTQFLTGEAQSYENLAEPPAHEQNINHYEQNVDDFEQNVDDYEQNVDDFEQNVDDYEQPTPEYEQDAAEQFEYVQVDDEQEIVPPPPPPPPPYNGPDPANDDSEDYDDIGAEDEDQDDEDYDDLG